jgi:hypothetical protein
MEGLISLEPVEWAEPSKMHDKCLMLPGTLKDHGLQSRLRGYGGTQELLRQSWRGRKHSSVRSRSTCQVKIPI